MTAMTAIGEAGVVPVVVIDDVARALPLAQALRDGGLTCVEVTLRTSAGLPALAAMASVDGLIVGAGTVLEASHVQSCVDAGAQFVVSPGYDAEIADACRSRGLPYLPGAVTATEVQHVRRAGLRAVKFFPAEQSGGVAAVRALAAPFGDVMFMPTGGISPRNAECYLQCRSVLAVGASWVTPRDLIRDGDFELIRRLALEARELVGRTRSA